MARQPKADTAVETLRHPEDVTRVNIPTAETSALMRRQEEDARPQSDLFGDFDRIVDPEIKLDFYQSPENWSNRMILGDSLLVMNSLAEKEGLKGQV